MKQIFYCLVLAFGAMILYTKSSDSKVLLEGALVDKESYTALVNHLEKSDTTKLLVKAPALVSENQMHQCAATTNAGEQCKRKVPIGTDYCYVHNPDTPRCGSPTSKGTPCKMVVPTVGDHCRYHQ